jgi:cytochrome P450
MDILKHRLLSLPQIIRYIRDVPKKGAPQALEALIGDRDNPDVMVLDLGFRKAHYVFNPDMVPEILRDPESFQKPSALAAIATVYGKHGMFTSRHDVWKKQKSSLKPYFVKKALVKYEDPIQEETARLVEKWATDGGTDDLYDDFRDFALTLLFKTSFSFDIDPYKDELKQSIDVLNKYVLRTVLNPMVSLFNIRSSSKVVDKALDCLRQVLSDMCEPYTDEHQEGAMVSDMLKAAGYYDAGDDFLKQQALEQVYDEIWQLIAAGYESTASSLTWAVAELGRNPQVQSVLRQEISQTLGDDDVTTANSGQLKEQNQFMAEVLRLYPTLHSPIPRKAEADVTLSNGYKIGKGDYVVVPIYNIQRDKRWFNEPESLMTQRMSPQGIQGRPKHAYLPFLAGAHICMGRQMFYQEAITAMSQLLRHFDIALDGDMPEKVFMSSITPERGTRMRFDVRDDAPSLKPASERVFDAALAAIEKGDYGKARIVPVSKCPFGHDTTEDGEAMAAFRAEPARDARSAVPASKDVIRNNAPQKRCPFSGNRP